jgi:drug/metabolite transporter (DMT)-like permease
MGISRANTFTNIIPVFTAVFAFFMVGEKLTIQNLAGMIIVITGLFLSQSDKSRKNLDDALLLTGKTA